MNGGEQLHVIGTPFIQGPALSLIFRTPHGDVTTKPLEFYSESVLFFELPPYPMTLSNLGLNNSPDFEIKVSFLVSNDGRTYSNVLDFWYLPDSNIRARI
jgi:hypothetical protein